MKASLSGLFAAVLLASCVPVDLATLNSPFDESAPGNAGAWWTSHPYAPTRLFVDSTLEPAKGSFLSPLEVVSLVSISGPNDLIDLTPPATFTFQGNGPPRIWSGAISLMAAPVNLVGGFYDFTSVASVRFLIKTAIDPAHLSILAQVGTKPTDQRALVLSDLVPGKDLNSWTLVQIPSSLLFLENADLKKVRSLGILWGATTSDTTLSVGASFQIGEIAFEDSTGAQVPFAALREVAPFPTTLAPTPTLDPSDVTSLWTSSNIYSDSAAAFPFDWNADWLQNGYLTTTTIAGKTVKVLNLSDYHGINITGSGSLSGATTSLLNLNDGFKTKLHISYWSSGGGFLNVDFLNGPSGGVATSSWATRALISKQWDDLEFDLPANVKAGTTILSQLKFTNETVAGSDSFDSLKKVIYLDNIYFH